MGKHILCVDDDPEDLETIKTILEKEGYEITGANNGEKALELLVGDDFAAILLDILMPTLSGYDLLRLMREKVNHKAKMVYVSIVPEKEVDMADVDGFVQKPFGPETLVKEVKRVLGDD